jgi:hypothetical protein
MQAEKNHSAVYYISSLEQQERSEKRFIASSGEEYILEIAIITQLKIGILTFTFQTPKTFILVLHKQQFPNYTYDSLICYVNEMLDAALGWAYG